MEGMSCLEPLEQSILHSPLVARPSICVMEERSEWKPVINPIHNKTLDGRLTYLERSALGVSLDSGLTEGASCLEPLVQSVLSSSLVARPIEGITEKVSDWKPVINPVQDITPDGRHMEGTAYPEHSALGVSLDSGFRAGMSSLEPLQQSVLNTLLVARPEAGIMMSDWKPVINPVQDITPDGRPMEGTAYPEHSALGVSLDSGLREGMSSIEPVRQSVLNMLSVTRPEAGLTKETTDWEPMALPIPSTTLDGRLREGNTYPEHSALGRIRFRTLTWTVSLWRGILTWSHRLWGVSGQWTHGGDVASGTIGAVSARSVVGCTTGLSRD